MKTRESIHPLASAARAREARRDAGVTNNARAAVPAVLALQGSAEPHLAALARLGHEPRAIRRPEQLDGVSHLIIPGGESTTMEKLLRLYRLWDPILERARRGDLAVFGTCAGAILLGRRSHERPARLALLDIDVDRNAYGRQAESFETTVHVFGRPLRAVFIRAPKLRNPGDSVEVLATHEQAPILVRQGRLLASTFHPELTPDGSVHEYFLSL